MITMPISSSPTRLVFAMILTVLVAGPMIAADAPGDEPKETTVMSFNIRYGAADDGDNSWTYRRDLVFQTIAGHEPAIFGVQECLWFQGEELKEVFPDYRMTGVGRDDGEQEGEMCAIFTLTDRYQLLAHGTFWLSETPEVIASKGWDAALPRIATWVRLYDRWCEPDTLFVFNAHFDHVGKLAREKSTTLLRSRMPASATVLPARLGGTLTLNRSRPSASISTSLRFMRLTIALAPMEA
jgi:endonuclease/exonuclease/phosphatase family metal-dependent hydrolase